MSSVYFVNVVPIPNAGLCNQLNSIVTAICESIGSEKSIIVMNKFLREINTKNFAPVSSVINMRETNSFLKKYNIVLLDGYYLKKFQIISVKYGTQENMMDVTDIARTHNYIRRNGFFINKSSNLNSLIGDPAPGQSKRLELEFTVNFIENKQTISFEEFNGCLKKDVNISFSVQGNPYVLSGDWNMLDIPKYQNLSKDIFRNLVFCNPFLDRSARFIKNMNIIQEDCKIDVIHLRLENDAIIFWSNQNKISTEEFKNRIVRKYIELIKNNIEKSSKIMILTYNIFNPVVRFLKENGYDYYFCVKDYNGNREESAIVDLLNSKACNNVFIGADGSTFTHTIAKLVDAKHVKYIDINHV
jgi:hypothetical protein